MIISGGYFKNRHGEWERFEAPEVGESEEPRPEPWPWPHPAARFMANPPDPIKEPIMPTMRAKFYVTEIVRYQGGIRLNMRPVGGTYKDGKYEPQTENSKFWEASPSGQFSIGVNEKAPAFPTVEAMKVGDAFYLDFTPAIVVDQPAPAAP